MGSARSRQAARWERKLQRREKRRGSQQDAADGRAELKYAVRLVLAAEGQEPDAIGLAQVPTTLMSDVLVELLQPYICWPPASDALDELEGWLRLGADVWNVTVQAKDGASCARGLERLAAAQDEEARSRAVYEIARRKFVHLASDWRRVVSVRVVVRDGYAIVEATSAAYVPGAVR